MQLRNRSKKIRNSLKYIHPINITNKNYKWP